MSLAQLITILRARWITVVVVFVLIVGTVLTVSLLLPKRYTATAAVVVDVRSVDPVAGMVQGALATPAYMATQIDIVKSDRVALRVVDRLRLVEDADMREQ